MADNDILKRFGSIAETVESIRLAPGVVGKTAYAAIAALAVLGVVAWRLSNPVLLAGVAFLAVGLFGVYVRAILRFAAQHPDLALLEGSELLLWRRMDLAAKGVGVIPAGPLVVDPDSPPALPPPGEEPER